VFGVSYSFTVHTSGGSGTNTSWSATNGLPAGLSINNAGVISGIPTALGPAMVNLAVSDSSGQTGSTLTLNVVNPPPCNVTQTIGTIQGTGDASTFAGQVETTSGIVTGLRTNGFFIQMPAPGDGNALTSDGIFVFTSSAPTGAAVVGNLVCITGTVT